MQRIPNYIQVLISMQNNSEIHVQGDFLYMSRMNLVISQEPVDQIV